MKITTRSTTPRKTRRSGSRHNPLTFLRDDRGLTTVEYIIILCLVAVVGFAIWKKFGETIKAKVQGADTIVGTLPTESAAVRRWSR